MSNLDNLCHKVDGFFEALQARHGEHMECGRGCSSCCRGRLTLFEVEIRRLVAAVQALDEETRAEIARRAARDEEVCPLLDDSGQCRVYDVRPIICRSHGAPIRVDGRRDVCPLNFTGPLPLVALPDSDVLDLEQLNAMLSLINRLEIGDTDERHDLRKVLASCVTNDYNPSHDE